MCQQLLQTPVFLFLYRVDNTKKLFLLPQALKNDLEGHNWLQRKTKMLFDEWFLRIKCKNSFHEQNKKWMLVFPTSFVRESRGKSC